MSTTRVLIADDHESVRKGIRSLLEHQSELKVVGEAQNGEEAVAQVQELKPDLVIMDVSMPILDGLTAAREIRKFSPGTLIVIFSMHKIKRLVEMAKSIGLGGYVAKEDDGEGLLQAIDAVRHNQAYFPA